MEMIHITRLEIYVYQLCKELSINDPNQLKLEKVARKLRLEVRYSNSTYRFGNVINIERSTPEREWQDFAHELGHYLLHVGSQLNMHYLFVQLQEWQADLFAYHFCVPTFMLMRFKEVSAYVIADLFNVEYDFALKRLE